MRQIFSFEISTSDPLITHQNLSSGLFETQILGILYMVCQEKIYTMINVENDGVNPKF